MQRKVTKFTNRPFDHTGTERMNFDMNVGDTFIELDAGELQPPEEGMVFGVAWGNLMWMPEANLSARKS
ncbi:MAG TPA: hypothetical protein V6C89_01680 [Drouetiella sp.]|jgi:hypothetical protein